MKFKPLVCRLLGNENVGRLDYILGRKPKDPFGGPLNGQSFRQHVYSEIMSRIDFQTIVETGTFHGTTTEFFAQSGLPVYTVEIHPRAYGYASLRLFRKRHQIQLFRGDSREFLRLLADRRDFPKSKVFFYLDAHVQDASRYHQAPLVEELEIIFTNWTEAVVMVDDFQVPRSTYSFDDWGPGKTLNVECLKPLKHLNLTHFFPAVDALEETGARRGWVILCREDNVTNILRGIDSLISGVERNVVSNLGPLSGKR